MPPDAVLSLSDLDSWSYGGTALAVLGHPIKHSISPAMHNAALAEMARTQTRFSAWKYFRFDVAPADLPQALKQFHEKGFFGLNLTVPHKVIAFEHVAEIDPSARAIGAVNTLRRTASGWKGHNTDGYGLASGLRENLRAELSGAHVLLLGAGGAARGAAVECLQRRCAALWIANRTRSNLDELLSILRPLANGIPLHGVAPQSSEIASIPAGALVINATSAGLRDTDEPPLDLARLAQPAAVYDMIYNPPQTRLLAQAASRAIPTANGLSMLVHQGARALELWSDTTVPVAAMQRAAERAMSAA